MAGPLNRTLLEVVFVRRHQVSATQDEPHVRSYSCWYVDMWPLWASPWEEGSERWRGTYLSLLESRLPSQVAMSGKSLLWVSKCLSVLLSGCLITQIYREGLVNHSQREAESYRND